MRRIIDAGWVLLVACGPEVVDGAGSDGNDGTTSGAGASASAGPTSATTTASGTSAAPGEASGPESDADSGATSTGAELPPAFLGQWICDGYDEPIYLVVDAYEPNLPSGKACIADGNDGPAPSWTRCAVLSVHPLDTPFWVRLDFGDELVLDLFLIHDLELDELDGRFYPGLEVPAHCVRHDG